MSGSPDGLAGGESLEHRTADQLLDEGRGHPLGAGHHVVDLGLAEGQRDTPGVDREQPSPGAGVRQGDLHRDVDPAGSRRQRRFEQVRAVGGEQEQQVGVGGGAVHRIEQGEQHRVRARAEAAVLRHQVDVLEDDDRRLQVASHLGDHPDRVQGLPGQHQHRAAAQLLHDVAGGVRLARPGRAEEQQPPLEVLPRRAQGVPVGDDVEGVPLHPPQRLLGEHDVLARSDRQHREGDRHAAVADRRLEHLSAVDVEPVPQLGQLAQHLLGGRRREPGDLDGEHRLQVPLRTADQHDVPSAGVLDEQDGATQAGRRPVRPGREVDQVGRREPDRTEALAVHQVLQRRRLVVWRDRHAVHGHGAVLGGSPDVERDLQVDVLEDRELDAEHRLLDPVAEVVLHESHDRVAPALVVLVDPLEEGPVGLREGPCLVGRGSLGSVT